MEGKTIAIDCSSVGLSDFASFGPRSQRLVGGSGDHVTAATNTCLINSLTRGRKLESELPPGDGLREVLQMRLGSVCKSIQFLRCLSSKLAFMDAVTALRTAEIRSFR